MQKFFGLKLLPWRNFQKIFQNFIPFSSQHCRSRLKELYEDRSENCAAGDKEGSAERKRNQLHYYHFIAIKTSQSHSCAEVKVNFWIFPIIIEFKISFTEHSEFSFKTFYVTFNVDYSKKHLKSGKFYKSRKYRSIFSNLKNFGAFLEQLSISAEN